MGRVGWGWWRFFHLHTCDMLWTWRFLHLHTRDMLRKSWEGLGGWGGDADVSITCTHTCDMLRTWRFLHLQSPKIPSPTFRASKMDEALQQPPTSTSCGGRWSLDPWWPCLERNMKVEVLMLPTQKPAIICPFIFSGEEILHISSTKKLKSVFSKLTGILCSVGVLASLLYFFSGLFNSKMCFETWGLGPYVPIIFGTSKRPSSESPTLPFPTRFVPPRRRCKCVACSLGSKNPTSPTNYSHLGVSENSGFSPKSSILIRFSIIFTIHFGVPVFLETPIWVKLNQKQKRPWLNPLNRPWRKFSSPSITPWCKPLVRLGFLGFCNKLGMKPSLKLT